MAQLNISKPVGDVQADGSPSPNMYDDTLVVQHLLNQSPGPGKPNPPLKEDGAITPQFISAIRAYESSRGPVDGRIDPGDATMVALNAIALSEFEGVGDVLERRSIIERINSEWNFTRGDFKTLTDMAGLSLRFDLSTTWLPEGLKSRFLRIFNGLLKPEVLPANTWGVNTLDWFHCHLGVWSHADNQRVSQASKDWIDKAVPLRIAATLNEKKFLVNGEIPAENIAAYKAALAAWFLSPEVADVLNSFVTLPEGMIVHHTFESTYWRPPKMEDEDPRRHWMVDTNGDFRPAKYRGNKENNAAASRDEFIHDVCQINFLIDKSGVIHPILLTTKGLSTVTGLPSSALRPPVRQLNTAPAQP